MNELADREERIADGIVAVAGGVVAIAIIAMTPVISVAVAGKMMYRGLQELLPITITIQCNKEGGESNT